MTVNADTMSLDTWTKYRDLLKKIDQKAADEFRDAVFHIQGRWKGVGLGNIPRNELIDYAYALVTKYGEASATVAAEMYDLSARIQGANVPPALTAPTATIDEVGKTINGILKQSENIDMLSGGISRLVKIAGSDTTLMNAHRDRHKSAARKHSGAQVAWVPSGDTCAFCIMLASRGWQPQSQWAAKNHAEHIHSNCDCVYMVKFKDDYSYEGYDPEVYRKMYDEAEGDTPNEKLNSMRREFYAENKNIVGSASDKAEEFIPDIVNKLGNKIIFERPQTSNERVQELRNQQEKLLKDLSAQYDTRLEKVTGGAERAAGDVDITGQIMRLNSSKIPDAIHEFAHTLANSDADKYGMTNDKDFWNEIRKIRTSYRKAVRDDWQKRISSYADSQNSIDEFFAEAFTLAKAKELGIELPDTYGKDYTFADMVLKAVDKYFKKK